MKALDFMTRFSAVAMLSAAMVFAASCEKNGEDDGNNGEPGTITDPGQVAQDALVAYFPFESEAESIAQGEGITFVKAGGSASFTKGRRGNAYQGSTSEAYLSFTLGDNNPFKSMKGYTFSMWVKSPIPAGAAPFINMDGGDATMGTFLLGIENGSDADGLNLKSYLYSTVPEAWKGQDFTLKNEAFLVDSWMHLVVNYDPATSAMAYYVNGRFVANSVRYSAEDPTADDDPSDQPLLGELGWSTDMTHLYVGSWSQKVTGTGIQDWMAYFPGQLDELRVYNRALTEDEISDLFDAEVEKID